MTHTEGTLYVYGTDGTAAASLPANITLSDSEHGFKRQLKTFLFQQSA